MALRNFSRFQGPIFYRTKKNHPFFPFFSFLRRTQRRRTLFNGLTEPLRSKNLPPSLSVPRSYGIIIRLFIIPRFISETRCLIHACSAEIAGVPIIQRFRGQQQWTPYVRCLQRSCCSRGKKKKDVFRKFFEGGNSVVQTRATREFALVSLYLYLSLYRPFLGRHVINQPVALCTSAREETHRVCFASSCAHRGHIERKYRAWTTSMTRNASACADARTALPQISHFSRIRFVSIRQSICDQTPPTSSIIDRYSFTRKKKKKQRKKIYFFHIYT